MIQYNPEETELLSIDEHLSVIQQLALWQNLFKEMGYDIYIEKYPSGQDQETIVYHAKSTIDPMDHFAINYTKTIKKEYDF